MPGDKQIFSIALNTAESHRWESRWLEAMQEYQRALAEFPEDANAHSGLGFCYMQTKNWQLALREYQSVWQMDPGNIIALSKTAELFGILSRRAEAYQAYLNLADLYMQASQSARAEAAWQKAVQLSPEDPEPHERLARYYFEKKDIAQMIQQRLAAAQGYLLRNEIAEARAQCEEVLRADGTDRQALQLLIYIQEAGSRPIASLPTGREATQITSMRPDIDAESPGNEEKAAAGPEAHADSKDPADETATSGNTSGGNTGIMGNMGSAGNYGGMNNPGPSLATAGNSAGAAPRNRIAANQITGALQQAQTYQTQGRFNDAIDLCEQILQSGFDRPDARYFLGWLYQEQQRWDDAIQQFQLLLNDPDYALSCYYALGQCYRARGDLRTATVHFDEAVDRVNLDALTLEESDQLVQLCQEAAEAHRLLGEQEQAMTVYNALLGFLRSRGWSEKVSQVEFMLQQAQGGPGRMPQQQAPAAAATSQPLFNDVPEAPTMAFNAASMVAPQAAAAPAPTTPSGELPDWLTGILSDSDKMQLANAPAPAPAPAPQPVAPPVQPVVEPVQPEIPSWLTDDAKPNATRTLPPEPVPAPVPAVQPPVVQPQVAAAAAVQPPAVAPAPEPAPLPVQAAPVAPPPVVMPEPAVIPASPPASAAMFSVPIEQSPMIIPAPAPSKGNQRTELEALLSQMAGNQGLAQAGDAVLASTVALPENVRLQVVRSMQDIQKYITHGLLTSATEECLRVIDIAPQYLDVHQVLCEIYVRQGNIEQAITKYAILVDTYIVNGRIEDAVATYKRILQLEPNNLTYRMRLIDLLSSQGNKEDLLRERTLAAESYLRLGYMDRAMTELEQALQESPTSVPTRLNYALALQKLGRIQQAVAEYQRVLQVDPRNIAALVRWHIAMLANLGTVRSTTLEVLTRINWQLRGEGQKNADAVLREYHQAIDIYPNNADLHYAIGQIYQRCAAYDKALEAYGQATRDNAVEVLARVSSAQILLAQGKPEAAIQQLEQSLQLIKRSPNLIDPTTWEARPREEGEKHQAPEVEISMQLANAYGRTGRQEQMQAILRQIKQGNPAQDEVVSTLSNLPVNQGDMDSVLQEYLEMVRHYRNSRQMDNALNVLKEMVRLAPQDARAHNELADIYVNRGLLDEGIAELRLLADIHLRNGELGEAGDVIQRVGNIYAEMGNTDEALSNLFRAAELHPESMDLQREVVGFCLQMGRGKDAARFQEVIARHYFETQQVKEAVAALQQLITIDRSNHNAYDLLGQTYQSVGEYEQASRVYRNLAKVNPGSSVARQRLATLQELRSSR